MIAHPLDAFDQQQPGESAVSATITTTQETSCGHAGSGVHPEPVSFRTGTADGGGAPSLPDNVVELGLADPFEAREWRAEEANRRLQIIETFESLLGQGVSKAGAVKQVGVGYATVWRWKRAYKERGFAGLYPSTDKCGRKSEVERLRDRGIDVDAILAKVKGINLDTESTTAALRLYANSDDCPEDLARLILDPNRCSKHALPPSIRKAVAVTENERKLHRGPRALALGGMYTPRKMDILPGDIFTADDTTPIWAWWVPWIECDEYPFGVKLLQGQFLPVIDVASQCPLTFVLIAREKSSYRASDIWHLFGHTFDTIGLPRLGWQLERGSWEANIIRGVEVEYRDGEATLHQRVGGLRSLPTNATSWHQEKLGPEGMSIFPKTLQTWTSYLPKSKSIEAFFNRSQTLEQTIFGCLGRDQMRAPNERAKKLYQECQRGSRDPRQHFWNQAEMTAELVKLLDYLSNDRMEGEVFKGVPRQMFDQARSEYPLFHLPDEQRYLYRREWRTVQITHGWARVRLSAPNSDRYSLFYTNPRVFAGIEGQEVIVYFDQEDFEQPAQIHSARTGEFLCEAQYEERKGSFLGADKSGHDIRKAWRNAVVSGYGTIVKHAPSRQVPPEIAARREALQKEAKAAEPVIRKAVPKTDGDGAPSLPRKVDFDKQREFYKRQAELANRLRQLQGNVTGSSKS
jgi:hypothetical protein